MLDAISLQKYAVVVGGTYVAIIGLAVDPELKRFEIEIPFENIWSLPWTPA